MVLQKHCPNGIKSNWYTTEYNIKINVITKSETKLGFNYLKIQNM